ncbi:hypothetical protein [Reichenbachiella sp.]|uniref:hypothetical protein n=1 Tax=Reichenbachiella sp. TaxID=2184521 RepID=UPI003BB10946
MKHNIFLYAMLASVFTLGACSDDDDESCEKDEVCEVEYSVCCSSGSDDDCTFVVDGVEYDSFEDASENFECTASAFPDEDKARAIQSLKDLTARAKANL